MNLKIELPLAAFDELKNNQGKKNINEPEVKLSGLVISRHCRLPYSQLRSQDMDHPLALMEKASKLKQSRKPIIDAVCDTLYTTISESCDTHRALLIKLKRDIFNHRPLIKYIGREELNTLDKSLLKDINDINNSIKEEELLLKDAEELLAQSLHIARNEIANISRSQEFMKGVQLSGRRTLNDFIKYSDAMLNTGTLNKKNRHTELKIVSYLYRMALKPSPFGSFTELKFHLRSEYSEKTPYSSNIVRKTLASRMLLLWMANQCLDNQIISQSVPLRKNASALIRNSMIECFSRGLDGAFDMYGKERFVALPYSSGVEAILTEVEQGRSKLQIIESLVNKGLDADKSTVFLDRLIECGLIEYDWLPPDQSKNFALDIANKISQLDCQETTKVANSFYKVDKLEKDFAVSDTVHRAKLMDEFHQEIEKISNISGAEAPSKESVRTYFYEDVGSLASPEDTFPELTPALKNHLTKLKPILGLFDEMLVERLSLYNFFKTECELGEPVDLFDFYKLFSSGTPESIERRMHGDGISEVEEVEALRLEFISNLWSRIAEKQDGDLDINLLDCWTDGFKNKLPNFTNLPTSTSFYLQKITNDFSGGAVLNGVSMGYGSALSRFCSIFDDPTIMSKALYDNQKWAEPNEQRVDITAVLGTNTNLHPTVWKKQLEYPGSIADQSVSEVIRPRDIMIRGNEQNKCLQLYSKVTGDRVNLAPLNFLYPTIGPSFYRFINLFSPYANFRNSTWLLYLSNFFKERAITLPRIRYGNVVLQRGTRILRQEDTANFTNFDAMTLSGLQEIDRWRKKNMLPQVGFYRGHSNIVVEKGKSGGIEKIVSKSRTVQMRKPHFINFKNPFLCRVLRAHILSHPGISLVVEESLPDISLYDKQLIPAAEESIFQLDTMMNGLN